MSQTATEWKMNTSQLEAGMLVRRPGLNEELEVASVKDGKAKIKLPGGKTTTVAATMAIEFRWPGQTAKGSAKPEKGARKPSASDPESEPEETIANDDTAEDGEWLSDWSLLAAGQTIKVLGETAEFNVIRVTDSSARIKNNSNAQIQGLSIGHKFQIVKESATATASEAKGKAGAKSGGRSHKTVPAPAPEPEGETEDDGAQTDLDFDADEEGEIPADIKAEIDHELNGDSDSGEEDEEAEELEEDDEDDDTNTDDANHDEDQDEEERSMPQSTKPRGSAKSTKSPEPAPGSEWITVQQLSDALGCNPPRINTLRAKNKLPKGSWKQDPNDSRRLLYLSSLVEKLKDLAHGKRGGGKKSGTAKVKVGAGALRQSDEVVPRRDGRKAGRPRKQVDPVDGPAPLATVFPKPLSPANAGLSLDAQLAAAIELANGQILGLQNVVANLEAQREQLRMWS